LIAPRGFRRRVASRLDVMIVTTLGNADDDDDDDDDDGRSTRSSEGREKRKTMRRSGAIYPLRQFSSIVLAPMCAFVDERRGRSRVAVDRSRRPSLMGLMSRQSQRMMPRGIIASGSSFRRRDASPQRSRSRSARRI